MVKNDERLGISKTENPSLFKCRVLTEKMQEQSLVSQGFAGF